MNRQPRFKNDLLEQHSEHFIVAGSTVIIFRMMGLINDNQILPTFGATLTLDYIRRHYREILARIMPELFIM